MNKILNKSLDELKRLIEWIKQNRLKSAILFFTIGVLLRISFTLLYYFTVTSDWCDMNEKVWIALSDYLINGINPYGQNYQMPVLDIINEENYFQYPPLIIIIHLPTLLWPGPARMGLIDFYPAFYIIHFIIDIYIFYRLWNAGYYGSAIGVWIFASPLFAMLDFSNFIMVPMLFIILAYLNMDNAFKSSLYIGLGVASYTYVAIPALFFFIYHYRKSKWNGLKKFILGLIPAILIILPFFIWDPITFISDIFISQGTRVSGNFLYPYNNLPGENTYWWMHVCSIPPYLNTIYNLIVDPSRPLSIPHLTTVLTGLALLLTIYYLYKFWKKPYRGKFVYWSCLMTFAFIFASPSGYAHIIILPIIILIFAFDLRKEISIDSYLEDFKAPVIRHRESKLLNN
ncbi:MAG: hypothetical protein ACTSPY_04505 [Candidatus Helarchaeota archaeon]